MTLHRAIRAGGVALLAVLLALAWPAAAGNSLVAKGVRVVIAGSALSVVPDRDWNRLGSRAGRNAESWTLDGPPLNRLALYGGIASGMPLFKDRDHRNNPLPRFAGSMLPTDITGLLESSYRIAIGTALMSIDSQAPTVLAGEKGVRFTYSFTIEGESVRRLGIGEAAIVNGKLYMITFEAPALHYFEAGLPGYRAAVASATLG